MAHLRPICTRVAFWTARRPGIVSRIRPWSDTAREPEASTYAPACWLALDAVFQSCTSSLGIAPITPANRVLDIDEENRVCRLGNDETDAIANDAEVLIGS